jgi:hypothetical protein
MTDRALFHAALDKSNPAERATDLGEVCGNGVAPRGRAEERLQERVSTGGVIEPSAKIGGAIVAHASATPAG